MIVVPLISIGIHFYLLYRADKKSREIVRAIIKKKAKEVPASS